MNTSKEQKYMMNSKTFMKNSGELTELCINKCNGDMKCVVMLVRKYTSFINTWLKENWEVRDDIKEGILKKLTADWFIAKIQNQLN